jgi:NAD(P)-dependent dehydrogenase (short-subunit alcohol dehydrogenase family)
MNFSGKIAVVTGAASGIGEAIAKGLVDAGSQVASLDVNPASNGKAIVCDLGENRSVTQAAQRIKAEMGVPDILVHCAATTFKGPVLDTPIGDFERIMNLNLYGALRLTNAFISEMRMRKSGALLYMSSINAKYATPEQGAYAASKAALDSVVKTMAVELAPDGIRINSIQPASIKTSSMMESYINVHNREAVLAANIARHPLGRWGMPEEVAKLALFLLSDDAGWITGAHYAIDGGAGVTRR